MVLVLLFMQLFLKMLSGMANNVDIQEQSDLGLHCLDILFFSDTLVCEILGHLPYHILNQKI